MTETLKVLGQSAPGAATPAVLYTVPAATSTVVSSLVVCNQSAVATSFRVSVSLAGAATVAKDYLYYDLAISGNNTFTAVLGISLATTDVVRVYATLATLSFSLFGLERT